MSNLVGNPKDIFSHDEAHLIVKIEVFNYYNLRSSIEGLDTNSIVSVKIRIAGLIEVFLGQERFFLNLFFNYL